MLRTDKPIDIVVVGNCVMDLITNVNRMPKMGETMIGEAFTTGFGGKGANQAVMAARLGARVAMVARVGSDVFGRMTIDNFKAQGVACEHVHFSEGETTGVAPILVQSDGQNIVLIVPGANSKLGGADVAESEHLITQSKVVLCQLGVAQKTVIEAFRLAREHQAVTILNPAPAQDLDPLTLELTDYLIPNETELELLTGCGVDTRAGIEEGARSLWQSTSKGVIVTLGSRGSLLLDREGAHHLPASEVRAVDTTGAGDAFVGTFAALIANGVGALEGVRVANEVAAMSVTKVGTQTSFPNLEALEGSRHYFGGSAP